MKCSKQSAVICFMHEILEYMAHSICCKTIAIELVNYWPFLTKVWPQKLYFEINTC